MDIFYSLKVSNWSHWLSRVSMIYFLRLWWLNLFNKTRLFSVFDKWKVNCTILDFFKNYLYDWLPLTYSLSRHQISNRYPFMSSAMRVFISYPLSAIIANNFITLQVFYIYVFKRFVSPIKLFFYFSYVNGLVYQFQRKGHHCL